MTILQYIEQVNKLYKSGLSSEHSYRGDLRTLLEAIVPGVMVTNEPKRIDCGAPDYIITRNEIPVGYIEAKDIGKDIGHKDYKEQFDRYRKSLNNLIITDYLDFWLFIDGEFRTKLRIAEIIDHQIRPIPEHFDQFNTLIKSFCTHVGQTIKSASKLSEMMADKAKLLAEILEKALTSDEKNEEDSTLKEQMHAFKDILIHDITPKEFADIYAQTIAYGMFAARLHDTTLDTFTRQEAAELIPRTNPFLRRLFQYVAGYDLDSRIAWIVDALADIFRATDVAAILQNFGKATRATDPIIHFYETFLAEYDPALRKSRGVWYTPQPVVNFIVRSVDEILKVKFNLPNGLADNSKTKITQKTVTKATADQRSKVKAVEAEIEVHKVQILDPATGTGTFLAEVVKQVYGKFQGQQGIWNSYVENHLIPRLNGFELLMASYAMAHLKLDMLFSQTGYSSTRNQRFHIYLTNSLEEYHQDTGTLFANWLSSEANEANHLKRDAPMMVVIGNPPYFKESSNKGDWIMALMADYKKEPDSNERLKERNPKWINNDYVKFLRYGQYLIEKTGEGVLAFINPNGFLDNPTFRGVRWNLLNAFDDIYTIDLHGDSNIKELTPEGKNDYNVFDIKQGVSINFFIKYNRGKSKKLARVFKNDLWGTREYKYEFLSSTEFSGIDFNLVDVKAPYYLFSNTESKSDDDKDKFSLAELFKKISTGYYTGCDELVFDYDKGGLMKKLQTHFKNSRTLDSQKIKLTMYRPFDERFLYYDKDILERARFKFISNFIDEENFILLTGKSTRSKDMNHFFISRYFSELKCAEYSKGSYMFPLYFYDFTNTQELFSQKRKRSHNLNDNIIAIFSEKLGIRFNGEKEAGFESFSPVDILDYVYAILYSRIYRVNNRDNLKMDFPILPYPANLSVFWHLVNLGQQLRQQHTLQADDINKYGIDYPVEGNNIISAPHYADGNIFINEKQIFSNVPKSTWDFNIGGYQPAQRWLKERTGRELSFDDILHYQRMIVALNETDRLMKEIDKIEFA